jgi:hypothetical protein
MKKMIELTNTQKLALDCAYKSLCNYKDALDKHFLSGDVPYEVATKVNLFQTIHAIEDLLTKGEVWEMQLKAIDSECEMLDFMCERHPEAFISILEELEAVGKAFEALEGFETLR